MNKSIKQNVKKQLYKQLREYLKKHFTNHLGEVVENENTLKCYVKQSKCNKGPYSFTISCHGIEKEKEKLAQNYNLNKKVRYILDGITVKKHPVYIYGYDNCEIIIKNCNFNFGLYINTNGKCRIVNTNIKPYTNLSIYAEDLEIEDMDIDNHLAIIDSELNIYIYGVNNLTITNSTIGHVNENTKVVLSSSKDITLENSKIAGEEVKCCANTLTTDQNSSFTATDKVDLTINEFDKVNVNAPNILYIDESYRNEDELITLEKVTDPLRLKRLEFIEYLKSIRNKCQETNKEKSNEYKESLVNDSVGKVLKNSKNI